GAGRETPPRTTAPATVASQGEVLVTVARTDAPLDEVMRMIEQALKEH
ncbi:TetR family transcriptional regulator, partial [Streptomyces sp. NPDC048279]